MKIVVFQNGFYNLVREVGSLKPLAEFSLAEQLSTWREEIPPTDPPQLLVLSPEDEQLVEDALSALSRNIAQDRGLGRIHMLDRHLLDVLAEAVGWKNTYIPANGNAKVAIGAENTWLLAFKPLA